MGVGAVMRVGWSFLVLGFKDGKREVFRRILGFWFRRLGYDGVIFEMGNVEEDKVWGKRG